MPYICEKELSAIYKDINYSLNQYGLNTEMDLMRDYMLKVRLFDNEKPLGKLIVDYSPKKRSYNFRKDSDLSQEVFELILNYLGRETHNEKPKISPSSNNVAKTPLSNITETDPSINVSNMAYQAYVDGSFIDGHTGYGAVILKDGKVIHELKGRVQSADAINARQVGGEIQAVIEVLKWCENNKIDKIAIFYDFLNIEKWATGEYRTNTPMTQAYKQFIDKCNIKITWFKVESHTGVDLNDRADELAKSGAKDTNISMKVQKSEFPKEDVVQKNEPSETSGENPILHQMSLFDNTVKSNMTGWIIYNVSLVTQKFIEHVDWFKNAAEKNKIKLFSFSNDELCSAIIDGKLKLLGYDESHKPDFVIFWDKDIRLARQLKNMGFKLFNSPKSIMICDDKILTHQVLANNNIPMPTTIAAPLVYPNYKTDLESFVDKIEQVLFYPIIVKEAFGSFGAQVYLANNREELLNLSKTLIAVPHLYQQLIKTSYGRDVRLQVVGGKVIAAMMRVNDNDFKANITGGGRMLPFNPPKDFEEIAVKAAKLVGADFAGVDLLFGENDEPVLCEINSNAHMKNIFDCTGVDIADFIIKHIKHRIERAI